MNSISDRTQCTIAWLPVIILLRFAHVIFSEINVDIIINAFFVNVCHIYAIDRVDRVETHLFHGRDRRRVLP